LTNSIWKGNNPASKEFKPGTICYEGSSTLTLSADGISGNVTFRARNIRLTGNNYNLTPYWNGVLILSNGTTFPCVVLDVGGKMQGMIYNYYPQSVNSGGQVQIIGRTGFQLNGSIVAWSVKLSGSNWGITGSDGGTPEPMRLVE
jgi:hypothetical protein